MPITWLGLEVDKLSFRSFARILLAEDRVPFDCKFCSNALKLLYFIYDKTMSLDSMLTLESIEVLENYIDKIRPKEELRDRVDVSYKIENQSIIIYEIRPQYNQPGKKTESFVAKATFVKAKNHFKVFWLRADLKWHSYDPHSTVKSMQDFIQVIEEDKYGCFWG